MKKLVVMLLVAAAFAADRTGKISTIFVDGNNEAAQKIRKEIGKGKSCLALLSAKSEADAVLEVAENRQGWPYSIMVSGTLTSKSGELIWSGTRGAAEGLLWDLKKSICNAH